MMKSAKFYLSVALIVFALNVYGQSQSIAQIDARQDIRKLARVYSGFPTAELQKYIGNKAAVSELVNMLEDSSESLWWSTAVTMIGYLSPLDTSLANRLINFLESPLPFKHCPDQKPEQFRLKDTQRRELVRAEYEPKLNVPIALGYMLRKPETLQMATKEAHYLIRYLEEGQNSSFWTRHLRWTAKEKYMTPRYRSRLLTERSLIAMALISNPY